MFPQPAQWRRLPWLLAITDASRQRLPLEQWLPRLGGGAWVIFRDYDLGTKRPSAALAARRLCGDLGLVFLVARDVALAQQVAADGLHLPQHMLPELSQIRLRHPSWKLTAACHSEEAARAAREGKATAGLFSPVFPTRSHPGEAGAGPSRLREVVEAVPDFPIYALGGVNAQTVDLLLGSGCAGVAAIDWAAEL
ncbi:unnamed protein product [Effrenium voratum]|nr:unnamed protein product [Effrenium voratum]